jgi:hypothetical protein
MTAHDLEKSAQKAIQVLRKKKLEQGQPFMINSDILNTDQCFMEFPDGTLKVVEADSKGCDFRIVMDATPAMVKQIKKQLKSL